MARSRQCCCVVDYNHDPSTEVPPEIDPQRPPQRNDDNMSSHCGCPCSRSAADGEDNVPAMEQLQDFDEGIVTDETIDETSSDLGDESIDGDEGAHDGGHSLEITGFGFIPLDLIHRCLARHTRCTCHVGVIPEEYPFQTNYNSRMPSGFQSPQESLVVEPSSNEQSMMSSQVLSIHSRSSSVFGNMGTGLTFPILWNPLPLTPETTRFEYPAELSISGSEFSVSRAEFAEYDLW